jgi:hypothetical protein
MLTNAYKRRAYIRRFTETVVSTSYVSSVTPMCAACLKSTGEVDASFQQIFHLYVAPPPPPPPPPPTPPIHRRHCKWEGSAGGGLYGLKPGVL